VFQSFSVLSFHRKKGFLNNFSLCVSLTSFQDVQSSNVKVSVYSFGEYLPNKGVIRFGIEFQAVNMRVNMIHFILISIIKSFYNLFDKYFINKHFLFQNRCTLILYLSLVKTLSSILTRHICHNEIKCQILNFILYTLIHYQLSNCIFLTPKFACWSCPGRY
jgi:hypothetical protein